MHSPPPHNTFPADRTTHSPPKTFARPRTATRPRRALPLPHAAPTHAHRLRYAFPADRTPHSPPKTFARPAQRHALAEHFRPPRSADARPRSADARPQAARCTPADRTTHSPQRNAASPSVPLRTQKNGTAQCMCDAECLGRPSLRSVIGVGEPRAVRRRFGALAWRVGLRPQPWALRSRRCGRVLRA